MQIIRNLSNIFLPKNLALTIGNFDGVHLGHRKIISRVLQIAQEKNLASAILTFEPHPISLFNAEKYHNFRIFTLAQKLKTFADLGFDYAIILPFTKNLSEISAIDFVQNILLKSLKTQHLIVGYDFNFGKNRQGNFQFLKQQSQIFNFDLEEISATGNQEEIYSSSLIRQLISQGKIAQANQILGQNFAINGIVNHGRQLAFQLGFPTANLIAKTHIIKPKFAVYKSTSFIPHLNKKFSSITNFGVKPTVDGQSAPIFETHILNFSNQIYGKKITVELLDFLREEKKFSSIAELKSQIFLDIKNL